MVPLSLLCEVNSRFCLEIMTKIRKVKHRVINGPCICAPLGYVMEHVFAKHSLLVANQNDIQLTISVCLYIHAIRAEIMVALDLVTHAVRGDSGLRMVQDIVTPAKISR